MEITEIASEDLEPILALVKKVATSAILPSLGEQGREYFISKVLPDTSKVLDTSMHRSYKLLVDTEIIGFGAIREENYITHLFIDERHQGNGYGKIMLNKLRGNAQEVRLRASLNSVPFYSAIGFTPIEDEAEVNGIRFVHMRWVKSTA